MAARLASMLPRPPRGSSAASSAARSAAAAGSVLVRGSCPIAACLLLRSFAGDASSEHDAPRPFTSGQHGTKVTVTAEEAFEVEEKDLALFEAMRALYERWREHFKDERDCGEMIRRWSKFEENVRPVHEVNNSNLPCKLKRNEYANGNIEELTDHDTFSLSEEDITWNDEDLEEGESGHYIGPYCNVVVEDEFVATEEDMASSEAMWALYERWCEHFKEERDRDEMVRLFPKFEETVRQVHEVNNSNLPYKLEISQYADMKILERANMCRLTEEDFAVYKAQGLVDESHLEFDIDNTTNPDTLIQN
ncbi:unnamed protein product [Urochloa humidicola]